MRRLERGASYIPLIVVIVLLLVAVIWAYMKSDEVDQLEKQIREANDLAAAAEDERIKIKSHFTGPVSERLGMAYQFNESDKANWDRFRIDPGKVKAAIAKQYDKMVKGWLVKLPDGAFRDEDGNPYRFDPDQEQPDWVFDQKFIRQVADERVVWYFNKTRAPISDKQDFQKLITHMDEAMTWSSS